MNNLKDDYFSDSALVKKVLTGDRHAFAVIIKNTEGLVAMIVYKMIMNSGDRKDLAQDIYLKVFHRLNSFQFRSKLSTWIGQIAYNTCLHYLEKRKLVLIEPILDEGETGEEMLERVNNQPVATHNEVERLLEKKELSDILNREMRKLPPVYQTLLSLYQEELSQEEMMEITGLPQGTIKSYLFRARKILKENLLANYKKEDL